MKYKNIELNECDGDWYFEDTALSKYHDGKENAHKLKAWAEKSGVKKSHAYICCLGKVRYGRGHTCPSQYGYRAKKKPLCTASQDKSHAWFDHSRMFWSRIKQQYVLTAQPYDVSLDKYQEMEQFAAKHGLTVDISLVDAWWYPGRTPLIVWSKQ